MSQMCQNSGFLVSKRSVLTHVENRVDYSLGTYLILSNVKVGSKCLFSGNFSKLLNILRLSLKCPLSAGQCLTVSFVKNSQNQCFPRGLRGGYARSQIITVLTVFSDLSTRPSARTRLLERRFCQMCPKQCQIVSKQWSIHGQSSEASAV